jgi:hypothetical protein
MGTALRYCFIAWVLPILVGFLSTAVIAGATSKLGAAAVGPWMILAIVLELCFFAGASILLFKKLSLLLKGGTLIGLFFIHSLVQLGLFAVMGFSTLVMFNR